MPLRVSIRLCVQSVDTCGLQPLLRVSKCQTFTFVPEAPAAAGDVPRADDTAAPPPAGGSSDTTPAAQRPAAPLSPDVMRSVDMEIVILVPLVPELVRGVRHHRRLLHVHMPVGAARSAREDAVLGILLPELRKVIREHPQPAYRMQHGIPGRLPSRPELRNMGRPDLAEMMSITSCKSVRLAARRMPVAVHFPLRSLLRRSAAHCIMICMRRCAACIATRVSGRLVGMRPGGHARAAPAR